MISCHAVLLIDQRPEQRYLKGGEECRAHPAGDPRWSRTAAPPGPTTAAGWSGEPGSNRPGLLQHHERLEQVAHRGTHADDVVRDRFRAVRGDRGRRGPHDVEFLDRQLRQLCPRTRQRPAAAQLRGQDLDPLRLRRARGSRVHPGPRQQFRDHLLVSVGVLPHVEAGQMEPEGPHRFTQRQQTVVGQFVVAVGTQRRIDDVEVGEQTLRRRRNRPRRRPGSRRR